MRSAHGGPNGKASLSATEACDGGPQQDSPERLPNPRADESLPLWKRFVFALFPVCALLLILECGARIAGFEPARGRDAFVGFASRDPLFAETATGALETAPSRLRWFHPQRFDREKQPGTFRVFALGGSTTYGRPYGGDVVSFPAWLRELLPLADPSRTWEVINAGGISYASYRVAKIVDELVAYAPDLFVIYTGHNEFIERRTYSGLLRAPRPLLELAALFDRTATAALLRRVLGSRALGAPALSRGPEAILDTSLGPEAYHRDDDWSAAVTAHFRFNLNRIIDRAESAGARVVLVTPVSNLADFSPFKSQATDGLTIAQREEVEILAEAAGRAGDPETLLNALDAAAALDPRNAELQYRKGRALLALGRDAEAAPALRRARDEDVCPLRAPTAFVEIVRETARERGVLLVDFEREIAAKSPHGVPGAESLRDHLHPNARVYGGLAEMIVDTLAAWEIIHLDSEWNINSIESLRGRVLARIDRNAEASAMANLAKVFNWSGKIEEGTRAAREAVLLNPRDAVAQRTLADLLLRQGDAEAAVPALRRALRYHPEAPELRNELAGALLRKGRPRKALAEYEHVLRLRPDSSVAINNVAWMLATSGDDALRDPARAVSLARRAQERGERPDPHVLDTLAAAYAGLGDFDTAHEIAAEAIALARERGEAEIAEAIAGRLEGYRHGRPHRD